MTSEFLSLSLYTCSVNKETFQHSINMKNQFEARSRANINAFTLPLHSPLNRNMNGVRSAPRRSLPVTTHSSLAEVSLRASSFQCNRTSTLNLPLYSHSSTRRIQNAHTCLYLRSMRNTKHVLHLFLILSLFNNSFSNA